MAGEKDLAVMRFLEKPENFSDLFNGSLFRGKQVLKAEMLESMSGRSVLSFRDKGGGKVSVRRYRDAVCRRRGVLLMLFLRWKGRGKLIMLCR